MVIPIAVPLPPALGKRTQRDVPNSESQAKKQRSQVCRVWSAGFYSRPSIKKKEKINKREK